MISSIWLLVFTMLGTISSLPQNGIIPIPKIDFSPAQEVNNLEPSAIPEIESRAFRSNGNYLESTVEEVQNILKSNPDLPRLTKGEILDLLENITKEDMEKLRSLNKNRNGKAVLLVMPYSPKKNGETMEDLYTKTPVTQMIDTDDNLEENKVIRRKRPTSNKKESNKLYGRGTIRADYKTTISSVPTSETTFASTTIPTTTSSILPTTQKITTYRPRTRPPRTRPPTTRASNTAKPIRRRRITTTPTSTTIAQFQNHRYSDQKTDMFLPENAVRVTRPPVYRFTRRTTTRTPDLSIAESHINNVYMKYELPQDKSDKTSIIKPNYNNIFPEYKSQVGGSEAGNQSPFFKPLSNQLYFNEETTQAPQPSSTPKYFLKNPVIPEDLKYIVEDLDLDSTMKKESFMESALRSATIFPRTTTRTTTKISVTPMPEFEEVADNLSPDMRNLLMTFGLIPNHSEVQEKKTEKSPYLPDKPEEHADSYVGFKPLPEEGETDKEMDALLASFGLGRSARKGKKLKKHVIPENHIDFSIIPEPMMGIIDNLGLNKANIPKKYVREYTTPAITKTYEETDRLDKHSDRTSIVPGDISSINNLDDDIQNEAIPLIELASNDSFSLNPTTVSETEFSVNNTDYDELSEEDNDFESLTANPSEINSTEINLIEDIPTIKSASTSVVFNPTDQKIVQKEKEQIYKLMELIKTLKNINGSASEEHFKNFDLETLKQFTEALNSTQKLTLGEQLANGIDPINFVDGLSKFNSKREETTTESEVVTFSLPQATTEMKSDAQVLEEAFAGLPPLDEGETEAPTTKKLSSGAYYLIDWNTFLEVDNAKGKRVNLRFQPTVGDPGRFYSINNN